MATTQRRGRSAWALVGALVVGACSGGGGGGFLPPVAGEGRWFGTITISSSRAATNNTNQGGINQQQNSLDLWTTTITIDETGKRTTTSEQTYTSFTDTMLEGECFAQHSTSATEATAEVTTNGPLGYFSLKEDGAGGFAATEYPALVQAPQDQQTHNFVEYITCDGYTADSSDNPVQTTGIIDLPLDQIKGKLKDARTAVGSLDYDKVLDGTKYKIRWALKRDKEVVAKVGGPYRVNRIDQVQLDAAKSRGTIDEYRWTVTPGDACGDMGSELDIKETVGKEVEHQGKTFQFAVVCPVHLHLYVRGPTGEDEDEGDVIVRPRKWTTEFEGSTAKNEDLEPAPSAGTNRCAIDGGGGVSGHYIHRSDSGWQDVAYAVKAIDQADSPFAGFFYTDAPKFRVKRDEVVDLKWAPNGSTYEANGEGTKQLLYKQVQQHEAEHSKALSRWVAERKGTSRDPARRVEKIAASSAENVRLHAEPTISKDEKALCQATLHDKITPQICKNNPDLNVSVEFLASSAGPLKTENPLCKVANDTVTCD